MYEKLYKLVKTSEELTAILRVVFQPLVWSDRSHDVINRHSSMERWLWLFGLYPSKRHRYKN